MFVDRQVRISYDPNHDAVVGTLMIRGARGRAVPISARMELRPLADQYARQLFQRALARSGLTHDQVGFGFLKKAWNKAWDTAKKVAKAVGVTKVLTKVKEGAKKVLATAKKVIQHPAFAAGMGIFAAAVPGVGPVVAAGDAGVRAAMTLADGVAKGDPQALKSMANYAMNTEGGQKVTALMKSVVPSPPTSLASNPWLQGLNLAI